MEVTVKVLMRVKSRWWDRPFVAMEFSVDFPSCGHIECLLSNLLQELTTGEPSEQWSIQYRREYHRSPRVGDAVLIGETAWRLEPGDEWAQVALQAEDVVPSTPFGRFKHRQYYSNRWRGNWRACMLEDVAERAAEIAGDAAAGA